MSTHRATGLTPEQASSALTQALAWAKDGDTIELEFGVEYQGPFKVEAAVQIIGSSGASVLYANTQPVLFVSVPGVVLRDLAIHYIGAGEGVALMSVPGANPTLHNVDLLGRHEVGDNSHAIEVISKRLDFGIFSDWSRAKPQTVILRNGGSEWHYQLEHDEWLDVDATEWVVPANGEQHLNVRLNERAAQLPPDQFVTYGRAIRVSGIGSHFDIAVSVCNAGATVAPSHPAKLSNSPAPTSAEQRFTDPASDLQPPPSKNNDLPQAPPQISSTPTRQKRVAAASALASMFDMPVSTSAPRRAVSASTPQLHFANLPRWTPGQTAYLTLNNNGSAAWTGHLQINVDWLEFAGGDEVTLDVGTHRLEFRLTANALSQPITVPDAVVIEGENVRLVIAASVSFKASALPSLFGPL